MTFLHQLHRLDQDFTLIVNSWGGPATDWLWQGFSNRYIWFPFYALVLFFLIKKLGWKRGLLCALACALTIVACDQIGNLVKNSVQRLRPCWDLGMVDRGLRILEGKGGKYGFYSSHAANAAGFAICSFKLFRLDKAHKYRAYGWAAFIWAFLVGLSRVFVGKHFLGDVFAGFAVGLIVGVLLAALTEALVRRLSL